VLTLGQLRNVMKITSKLCRKAKIMKWKIRKAQTN